MKTFHIFLIVIFSSLLLPGAARASCGMAECGCERLATDKKAGRWMRFDYEFEYLDQSILRNGQQQVPLGTQSGDHDEIRTINRIQRVRWASSLTERLSAELALPWVSRRHRHIDDPTGINADESWRLNGV